MEYAVYPADLKARTCTKAPAMAQVYSWTGFYVGVNGGYGWKDPSVAYTSNDFLVSASFLGSRTPVPFFFLGPFATYNFAATPTQASWTDRTPFKSELVSWSGI
jgi:hypothetical protein